MRLLSVLQSSFPQWMIVAIDAMWPSPDAALGEGDGAARHPYLKWWSRRVTLPHDPACKAGTLLVCHGPVKWMLDTWHAAPVLPRVAGFWRSGGKAGARRNS